MQTLALSQPVLLLPAHRKLEIYFECSSFTLTHPNILIYSMPGLISSVQSFNRASGLPDDVWAILHRHAARANVILPHAEKVFGIQPFTPIIDSNEQLWLVYTKPGASSIQFVLAITEGPMGKYPVFIAPTIPISQLTSELLEDSMEAFCSALLSEPGFQRERVFSIFSVNLVAEAFARAWVKSAGINRIEEPYYNAIFSTCFRDTLAPASFAQDHTVIERPAMPQDAQKLAILCHDFAATSPPFDLTPAKASKESDILISNKQAWVLEVESDIVSIVAVTRKSNGVAAITKVYTPEKWRGRRFAERLVHHVCKELLKTYEQVVLYVGVDIIPAKKVYDRVGFRGLLGESALRDGVEHWVEVGFDQTKVVLGHW